jgi:hypothetical protein
MTVTNEIQERARCAKFSETSEIISESSDISKISDGGVGPYRQVLRPLTELHGIAKAATFACTRTGIRHLIWRTDQTRSARRALI